MLAGSFLNWFLHSHAEKGCWISSHGLSCTEVFKIRPWEQYRKPYRNNGTGINNMCHYASCLIFSIFCSLLYLTLSSTPCFFCLFCLFFGGGGGGANSILSLSKCNITGNVQTSSEVLQSFFRVQALMSDVHIYLHKMYVDPR